MDPLALRSEADFLKDVRDDYTRSTDADRMNREQAAIDLMWRTGEQWSQDVLRLRKGRPSLVFNRMPQFVRQVTGDIRMNKPAAKVTPVSEGASKATAEVLEGLIRHIEYRSQAGRIYSLVADSQVTAGMGHMRLTVEYPDDSFDAELRISLIRNPFAVVWDHAAERPDRADAGFCFVEQRMTKKAFAAAFKDATETSYPLTQPAAMKDWITSDLIRVVEYWRVHQKPTKLFLLANGTVIEEDDQDSVRQAAEQVGIVRERTVQKPWICQYITNGAQLLGEPYEWPGKRIPIVTAWGEEVCTGEKTFRHGLIRFARDPQYLVNHFMSAAVETLALQPKPKWLVNAEAVKGQEAKYRDANNSSDALLTYNGANKPEFIPPPPFPQSMTQMAAIAEDAMKSTIGLYDASLGARSNETSGKAIRARQQEGDVGSFVYADNLGWAIENMTGQVMEMIPETYDAPRQVRILGEDMQAQVMAVNGPGQPNLKDAGKYDVTVTTGPSFTSRRAEAAEGMMELIRVLPAAAPVLGDLLASLQDWPRADEVAQRLAQVRQDAQPKPQAPPPPNPKDAAQAELYGAQTEKAAAEAEGVKLDNVIKAVELGREHLPIPADPITGDPLQGGGGNAFQPPPGPMPMSGPQQPNEPDADQAGGPSDQDADNPSGGQPGAPGAIPGQSAPQGA